MLTYDDECRILTYADVGGRMHLTVSFSTNMRLNPADGWTVNITGLTGVAPHTPPDATAAAAHQAQQAQQAQQQQIQSGQLLQQVVLQIQPADGLAAGVFCDNCVPDRAPQTTKRHKTDSSKYI